MEDLYHGGAVLKPQSEATTKKNRKSLPSAPHSVVNPISMSYPPISRLLLLACFAFFIQPLAAQQTIAREWNEAVLQTAREDLARPQVQARNLFHFSVALYDAWAAYDDEAETYLLGKTVGGFTCPCQKIPVPKDREAARREAMSFAAYRLLTARYSSSPRGAGTLSRSQDIMIKHGYNYRDYSMDYAAGSPAALGNYVAQCILQMSQLDGSNEQNNYQDTFYKPQNPALDIAVAGPPKLTDPNAWQPLKLKIAIDQDGNKMLECKCGGRPLIELIGSVDPSGRAVTSTQTFQGTAWGRVRPFALRKAELSIYRLQGRDHWVYHDPGPAFLPRLDNVQGSGNSPDYSWNFALVAAWSAYLNPADGVTWDVSPQASGNVQHYPQNLAELRDFYNLKTGHDPGAGRDLNPRTGQPYAPQIVPRGDFTRVAAQFWAEGPQAETPPGHWFVLLNYVSDQPGLVKKFNSKGRLMGDLEWDVKAYFVLGGALHDAAIAAWGSKGFYNSIRPISAIRYMAGLGQSTDRNLPSYHPAGIPLMPGRIEVVKRTDPLAGAKKENTGKIKIYAWKGPFAVTTPATQTAGVGWILAENWHPYQIKNFITPPFGGYVSGHSVFSRSAAEALTLLTGDEYFPGGLGEFPVQANSGFLHSEKGPSVDVTLQWATYRDAADQASLSRIWAGTNPPFDDIPGRLMGAKVGMAAFELAKGYFYKDRDQDGYLSYEDCDDHNPAIHPGATEQCDKLDNDCNGKIDDGLQCPDGQ